MNFRLVHAGWSKILDDAVQADCSSLRIICPFITLNAAKRLLKWQRPKSIRVITRFNLGNFCEGVSDINGLWELLQSGAQIRGVRNLHAKLYLIGQCQAIVTSANLTEAALLRNHEFGFVSSEANIVAECARYFDDLWPRAGTNLSASRLASWERKLEAYLIGGARPSSRAKLSDEGVDLGFTQEPVLIPHADLMIRRSFVKFFGEAHNRVGHDASILDEVRRSGSHWACTYPKGLRPRQPEDGSLMFMGRMVEHPHDIVVYGRAQALRHVPGRDDASSADIKRRPWKEQWPHYVRVRDAEFIAGNLCNGVSLNELMKALGSHSFSSTQRHLGRADRKNTDPRRAYRQKASVELSPQGVKWLNRHLELAFARYGKLGPAVLGQLDWPVQRL